MTVSEQQAGLVFLEDLRIIFSRMSTLRKIGTKRVFEYLRYCVVNCNTQGDTYE